MRGVRFCTLLSLAAHFGLALLWTGPVQGQASLPRPSVSPDLEQQEQRRRAELQNEAGRLIQEGQFQQAIRLLEGLSRRRDDAGPLIQMLDLQVRLKDEEGARRSMDSLAARLPADGRLAAYADFQVAGALAGARYRLGQPARAQELWQQMKDQADSEHLALAVFHSYRQVRLIDEALAWATAQRRLRRAEDLWAFELAQLHEEAGRFRDAFDELARWQCRQQAGGPIVEGRLLTLAEGASDRPALLKHMLERVADRRDSCPALGEAVLGVLVQQGSVEAAVDLAWRLDEDAGGVLPFALAGDLARDSRWAPALGLLEEMSRRGRPQAGHEEALLLRGDCLAGLDRPEEALELFRQAARDRGSRGAMAGMRAAHLLHRPLGRLPEAIRQLDEVLSAMPLNQPAARLQIQLMGCVGDTAGARAALARLGTRVRAGEERTELAWLGLQLDWWSGRLEACREGLAAFLKTNTRQDVFNDAIELMDLLAFATTDSAAVAAAARADRLAFAGDWDQALDLLHATAEGVKPRLAEWLDWRACQVATRELPPAEARAEYERYRRRQDTSLRLDRLEWMDLEARAAEGEAPDSLRAQALTILERWPHTLLQDTIRRRVRAWELPDAPPQWEPAAPAGSVDRPR